MRLGFITQILGDGLDWKDRLNKQLCNVSGPLTVDLFENRMAKAISKVVVLVKQ